MHFNPTFQFKYKYGQQNSLKARKSKTLYHRALQTTFWQKVVDAFRMLGGSSLFTIRKGQPGERLAIYPDFHNGVFDYEHFQLGLTDYTPLVVLKLLFGFFILLVVTGFKLWETPEGKYEFDAVLGVRHKPYNEFLSILRKIVAVPLIGIGLFSMFVTAIAQFIVNTTLTLLSLPFVGMVHKWSQKEKEKLERDFVEKYEQQFVNANVKIDSLQNDAGRVYRPGPTNGLLTFLSDRSVAVEESIDDAAIHSQNKYRIILFSKQGQYYFYQFTYDQAGRDAYAALREIKPDLCKSKLRENKEKKITDMFDGFSTLVRSSLDLPLEIKQKIATHVMDAYKDDKIKDDKTGELKSRTKVTKYPMHEEDRMMVLNGSPSKSRLTLFKPAQPKPKEKSLVEQYIQMRMQL